MFFWKNIFDYNLEVSSPHCEDLLFHKVPKSELVLLKIVKSLE